MTPARLLLVSLLLLAAGAGLWKLAQGSGAPPSVPLPEAVEGSLLQGDPAKLRRLTLEQPRYGHRLRVEPDADGRWVMTEPIRDRIEPVVLVAILGALWTEDWKEAPPEWQGQSDADLGLDPPAILGAVDYADGGSESFRIGAAGPGGRWYACRIDGRLVALGDTALTQLERPAQQLRDHRVQPFGTAVARLRWQAEDGSALAVERRSEDWYLLEPAEGRLSDTGAALLARLLGARAAGLGDVQAEPGDPRTRMGILEIAATEGDSVTLQLWRGQALSSDREYVLALSPEDLQFLALDADTLLTRRLVDFDADQVRSVRIEQGGRAQVFRLQQPGWIAAGANSFDAEVAATVAGFIGHAVALERGERLPVPDRAPDGRALYSISHTPSERGSAELRWWVTEGGLVAGAGDGDFVSACPVNLERAAESLLDRFGG